MQQTSTRSQKIIIAVFSICCFFLGSVLAILVDKLKHETIIVNSQDQIQNHPEMCIPGYPDPKIEETLEKEHLSYPLIEHIEDREFESYFNSRFPPKLVDIFLGYSPHEIIAYSVVDTSAANGTLIAGSYFIYTLDDASVLWLLADTWTSNTGKEMIEKILYHCSEAQWHDIIVASHEAGLWLPTSSEGSCDDWGEYDYYQKTYANGGDFFEQE